MKYFDFGKLESASFYDLFSIGFRPVFNSLFGKKFPEYNPFPDIEFCEKLEYRCRTNHNKYKMNFIADYVGFTAEKDFCEENGHIWEIYNLYGEGVETYKISKQPRNPKNDFMVRFKKDYQKYVKSYPEAPHFLYLITSHNEAGYKIGITNNPESRLKIIGTQLPFLANTIRLYPMQKKFAANMEKFYHFMFKSKHLNGEWFALELDDIDLMDYIYALGFIAAKPVDFEKFFKLIIQKNWAEKSVNFWNNAFRLLQEERHYMTLMNSIEYSDRINCKNAEFNQYFNIENEEEFY